MSVAVEGLPIFFVARVRKKDTLLFFQYSFQKWAIVGNEGQRMSGVIFW